MVTEKNSCGNLSFYDDSKVEEDIPVLNKIDALNQGGRHCIEPITTGEVVSLCGCYVDVLHGY